MIDQAPATRPVLSLPAMLVIAAVAALSIFLAVGGTGLTNGLSEWQRSTFGRGFPALNIALIAIVPLTVTVLLLARVDRRHGGDAGTPAHALARAERAMRIVGIVAAVTTAAAAIVLLSTLTLPSDSVDRRPVDARSAATPTSGAAVVTGSIITRRSVDYDRWVIGVHRSYDFVALAPAPADKGALRYFVQVRDGGSVESGGRFRGILQRDGLPSGARAAFEDAGYRLADQHAVLFADEASLRWPYYALAAQLVLIAAVLMLVLVFQRATVGRIRRAIDELP